MRSGMLCATYSHHGRDSPCEPLTLPNRKGCSIDEINVTKEVNLDETA